jgi:hypothetical protein
MLFISFPNNCCFKTGIGTVGTYKIRMSYSSIYSLKVYLLHFVDCDDSVTCLATS